MTDLECFLETLAPELLLPILNGLTDLESLDNLLRVSPASYCVFSTQSATVFKAVLSSGNTHIYTCALIRIIALLRADSLSPAVHDLDSFKDLVRHKTSPHRYETPRWVDPPTSWPNISATSIRKLLATNHKITFGCFEHYLDQFRPLRPFQSAEFSFDSGYYDSNYFDRYDPELKGPWQNKQANTIYHYPVHDIGPPS